MVARYGLIPRSTGLLGTGTLYECLMKVQAIPISSITQE